MAVVPFVNLGAQYREIEGEVKAAINDVLLQTNFILGDQVVQFEQAFANFVGVQHTIGVGSGLDALGLSLMALDIGPGDEVILPANTFIATALAVSFVNARPVLVDCNPATYNIDPELIMSIITPQTRAIIPVHLTGQAADMDAIREIAERYGIYVIEDAAQAHGTLYKGRPCGSLGIVGCFSFYPSKNLGAYGDGGMITTNDAELAQKMRRLRNYGEGSKNENVEKGLNTRLDTLQAAVLNVKLRHLPQWNALRAKHAETYRRLLKGVGGISFQEESPYSTHIYHLFIIETEYRETLREYLNSRRIQTGIHYPKPIHLQKAYADLGYNEGDFPYAERCARRMLSLPIYPEISDDQIRYVTHHIVQFFETQ